jgi:hypothetical protein
MASNRLLLFIAAARPHKDRTRISDFRFTYQQSVSLRFNQLKPSVFIKLYAHLQANANIRLSAATDAIFAAQLTN